MANDWLQKNTRFKAQENFLGGKEDSIIKWVKEDLVYKLKMCTMYQWKFFQVSQHENICLERYYPNKGLNYEKKKKHSLGSQAKLSSYMYKKRNIKLVSGFYPANSTPQAERRKPTKYLRKESRSKGIDIQPRILYPWKYET